MENRSLLAWLNYCFPAGAISGVRIRIHWAFPVLLVLYGLWNGHEHGARWGWVISISIALLFVIVLAHEFGHVFAARREGAPCEQVMLWPLGGLALIGEELLGPAEVKTAAAGPAVNLLALLALIPVLALTGIALGLDTLNPFEWYPPPMRGEAPWGFGHEVLYAVFKLNLAVMLFNLIPAFPMDGGRILRGILHERHGPIRSLLAVTTISFVFTTAMLVLAIVVGEFLLGAVALFVGLSAFLIRRQVMAVALQPHAQEEGFLGYDFSMGHTSLERGHDRRERKRSRREEKERKRREREADEERRVEEEVDHLLDKIHRDGMDSLTRKERAFLEQASRRKKK